jgi:hypothetical protein
MEPQLFTGLSGVERVEALGIDPEWLRQAVKAGEVARDGCSPLTPLTFPGLSAWANRIEHLRTVSAPLGWKPVNARNMPMVESPDGQVAIVCIMGDEATGLEGTQPKTRHDRGPVTKNAISSNWEQLSFLPQLPGFIETRQRLTHPFTYVLLTYRAGSKVRCELSLPRSMDEKGRVTEWAERILLDPIDLEPQLLVPEAPTSPRIDVEVNRKQG